MSADVTAKACANQFPDIWHESGNELFCTACNVVVKHKQKSATDTLFYIKTWRMAEILGRHDNDCDGGYFIQIYCLIYCVERHNVTLNKHGLCYYIVSIV